MKKLSILLIALLVTSLGVGSILSCEAEPGEPVALRMVDIDPPVKFALSEAMVERFNERAEGKAVIELHHGEELVSTSEMFDAVRTGAVEICMMPMGMFGQLDPRLAAAEIPFLYNNIRACQAAQEPLFPLYADFLEEEYNQKLLALFPCPGLEVCSAKGPVMTVEDWDGLLVQSISPVTAVIIETFGGAAVPIPYVEGYQALQKGLVDATIQSCGFMKDFALYEVADYVTVANTIPASLIITINLDTWNSLPKDAQDILVEELQQLEGEKSEAHTVEGETAPGILADELGMEVYYLPEAERDIWQEMLSPYTEQVIADLGEFGQELMQIAEEANSKFPY
jgi:TRAP-type C4-dicarboxylate transport system substrate-binding protein